MVILVFIGVFIIVGMGIGVFGIAAVIVLALIAKLFRSVAGML